MVGAAIVVAIVVVVGPAAVIRVVVTVVTVTVMVTALSTAAAIHCEDFRYPHIAPFPVDGRSHADQKDPDQPVKLYAAAYEFTVDELA